ncbi:MAG: hypothetical protein ACT4QD_15940 [Acidobacteriota bacterium]
MPPFRSPLLPAFGAMLLASALGAAGHAAERKFFDDDPVWVEQDHQDASAIKPWQIDLTADLAYNLFWKPGDPAPDVRAQNLNSVDEVPDSSWFTNRVGRRSMTSAEIARGPNTGDGPAKGTWTVTSSKTNGVTPGFTIRDSSGQVWFLKFDPPGYRGMATGAEVIVTKLLWGLGYHVPENYIARLRLDEIAIDERARFTRANGRVRPMRLSDVSDLLTRADREPDGSYRVIASRALPKVGEFRFYGTHSEDPNDLVPHEHRRELRGYGVFSAWVNHVDAKGKNTLDALIKTEGRALVRHYLQDFGATLGSASVTPREYWEGFEYMVEPGLVGRQLVGFGFVVPEWRRLEFFEAPSIGRFPKDNTTFDPEAWRPRVPNAAFVRARADDKFWAAQRLAAFSDELVRAAVQTGELGDPDAEAFLVKALAERRDAILRAYLPSINPLADPAIEGDVLVLRNAAIDARVASPPTGYRARWFTFDNLTRETRPLGDSSATTPRLPLPADLPVGPGAFVKVDVAGIGGPAAWERPVHVYLRRTQGAWRLVGLEREPE